MAADSPAEKLLIKLLVRNKLITLSQVERVLKKTLGRSEKKLHEELVDRKFVDPNKMEKVVDAVHKKNYVFPLLSEGAVTTMEEIRKQE